jgi:tetratricopeptide (TPR) repeat protein
MEKVAAQLGDNEARSRGLAHTARSCWLLYLEGDVAELYRVAQAGSLILGAAGDRRMQGFIEQLLGSGLVQLGDYLAACAYLRDLLARLEQLQEPLAVAMVRAHLALGLIQLGGPAELAEARQLAVMIGEQAFSYWQGLAHAIEAQILAREGAWGAAEEEIRQALQRSVPEYALQPMMYATLAEVLLGQGNTEAAVGAAREGLALLARIGGTSWLDIQLHLAAAQAFLQAGHREEARQVLSRAHQLLQLRAGRIPDEAARKRYLTAVPFNARVLELARQIA